MLSELTLQKILTAQRNEITEAHIYRRLAAKTTDSHNREVLLKIAEEETKHYNYWLNLTNKKVEPNAWKIWKYTTITKILGLTFGIKLMEGGEKQAQVNYDEIITETPDAIHIRDEEAQHENKLISLIDEERLEYMSSVVLGLNDALVELTGALAGLTLALQNSKLIAMAGLITGIAASLSMAASEYLSTKAESGKKNPKKAAIYTGIAYIITVCLLIMPYLVLSNLYVALIFTLGIAITIIFLFTYYIAVAKSTSFKSHFLEMAGLSLSVAIFSFGIGFIIRQIFGIEI
jgi:VIT1/CCC1 family predicted Fe2+/Mn2+ transporter